MDRLFFSAENAAAAPDLHPGLQELIAPPESTPRHSG